MLCFMGFLPAQSERVIALHGGQIMLPAIAKRFHQANQLKQGIRREANPYCVWIVARVDVGPL